ncbi:hypothetical protein, partial [Schlesneria paludicola]|uniref:hypothetical protein n=1 Tax=Schlesneria paludicola TaxID=360056 RepID=UPI000299F31E
MGDVFKEWKAGSITLIATTLLTIACLLGRGAFDRPAGNALQASPPTAHGFEGKTKGSGLIEFCLT